MGLPPYLFAKPCGQYAAKAADELVQQGTYVSSAKYVTLYQAYVERLQPVITGINRRYPAMAPADFDPYYGESWDEDVW